MNFNARQYLVSKGFLKNPKKRDTYWNEDGISMKFFKTKKGEEMLSIMDLSKAFQNRHMANIHIPDDPDEFEWLLRHVSVDVSSNGEEEHDIVNSY